ncbi:ferredoxin [Streptococcus pluranimalium]|uniref:ferredoxin n=1 Tax=Streptococcus pluranimalium TaxID=82348 RepID=UPI0039FCBB7F
MKVSLIPEKCIACGLCQTYSTVFDYHDNGIVRFADSDALVAEFPDNDLATLTAVKNCPTKALTL